MPWVCINCGWENENDERELRALQLKSVRRSG